MRVLQTGSHISIFDNSVRMYDQLPAGTYVLSYNQQEGCFLETHPNIEVKEKAYGVQKNKIGKVLKAFGISVRSLGVILSGDKGIGKSMFAKLLCEKAVSLGKPVIIVDICVPGVARFIESIEQECIVLFDEFDKTFRSNRDQDEQAKLLSLFDGTAGGKKLYVVTCNELYMLNDYIVNRPGRFHYHFRFDYPEPEEIREYLSDKLAAEYYDEIEKVVAFSNKINLNYDCLRAIAFEINQGVDFSEAAQELNILNINPEEYDIELRLDNGETFRKNRYSTNLFNSSRPTEWITFYGRSGRAIMDIRFDKARAVYDDRHNATKIMPDGLYMDLSDYDDVAESKAYMDVRPKYLLFRKCSVQKLHYTV